jgi:hypothetical protein
VTRQLVLDLTALGPDQVARFDDAVSALVRCRRPLITFGTGHLLLCAGGAAARIGIGYDLLPHGTERLRRSRRGIPALGAAIVGTLSATSSVRIFDQDDMGLRADWYAGWDVIRDLAASVDPRFMQHSPAAHPGSPWRAPRCYNFSVGGSLLTQEIVEHAFSKAPHILEFDDRGFVGDDPNAFTTRHEGSLGFDEDDAPDPVRIMRTWANAPEHVRMAA